MTACAICLSLRLRRKPGPFHMDGLFYFSQSMENCSLGVHSSIWHSVSVRSIWMERVMC